MFMDSYSQLRWLAGGCGTRSQEVTAFPVPTGICGRERDCAGRRHTAEQPGAHARNELRRGGRLVGGWCTPHQLHLWLCRLHAHVARPSSLGP